jgi:hypothetical protein
MVWPVDPVNLNQANQYNQYSCEGVMSGRHIAVLLLALCGQADAACLSYTERVAVEGELVTRTFPGPPNYESIEAGDRPETHWLVQLERPACVDRDPHDKDGLNPAVAEIRGIQLVLSPEQYRRHAGRLGQRVTVSGRLFGAHTAHHKTPVLLEDVAFGR